MSNFKQSKSRMLSHLKRKQSFDLWNINWLTNLNTECDTSMLILACWCEHLKFVLCLSKTVFTSNVENVIYPLPSPLRCPPQSRSRMGVDRFFGPVSEGSWGARQRSKFSGPPSLVSFENWLTDWVSGTSSQKEDPSEESKRIRLRWFGRLNRMSPSCLYVS